MPRPGFFNDNCNRAYPFIADSVRETTPDSWPLTMPQLPDDFLVDAGFILSESSIFVAETDKIWLRRLWRDGDQLFFEFESNAAYLLNTPLLFQFDSNDGDYAIAFASSDEPPPGVSESDDVGCIPPLWTGYLVIGRVASILDRVPDGDGIVREPADEDSAIIEPALIQNLHRAQLQGITIGNADRTRVDSAPEDCEQPVWTHEEELIFLDGPCLQGHIHLKPGFNCEILQSDTENKITFIAGVGSGEGEPCEEVPVFPGEQPPVGQEEGFLSGGIACNDTVRAINGVGGPVFNLLAGAGVAITPDPENHRIIVDVNLRDLTVCAYSEFSEISESLADNSESLL